MKRTIKFLTFAILLTGLTTITSCKKYRKYDNLEVVENTYTGNIELTGTVEPNGDFTGNGDSGTFSFAWDNPRNRAEVNFDVTTSVGGSVQIILNDAKGKEVFNKTRPDGGNDTFSGLSEEGKAGKWLVTIKLTNFNGDGTYGIEPRD